MAKNYKVYALDLLGFGWSEKALIEYDALVWRDQVVDFVKEIVKEPAVLVGNRQVLCTCSIMLMLFLSTKYLLYIVKFNDFMNFIT